MLSENIKHLRKAKGLSQQELAVKLNVVRQTVSKWEQGLSVPDSDLLIALSDALETPVSVLLGEAVTVPEADALQAISEKLEVINFQLAKRAVTQRKVLRGLLLAVCVLIIALLILLICVPSPYQAWDYADPEKAVFGAMLHAAEWGFVRIAPVILAGAAVVLVVTRKRG